MNVFRIRLVNGSRFSRIMNQSAREPSLKLVPRTSVGFEPTTWTTEDAEAAARMRRAGADVTEEKR